MPQLRSYLIQPRRRKSAVALLVAVTALLAATSSTASPTVSAKQAEAQRVLGEIQAIDSSLDKAVDAYNAAQMKLDAIRAEENLMEPVLDCVRAYATVGESVELMKGEYGTWREPEIC